MAATDPKLMVIFLNKLLVNMLDKFCTNVGN